MFVMLINWLIPMFIAFKAEMDEQLRKDGIK